MDMRSRPVLGLFLFLALGIAGCDEPPADDASEPVGQPDEGAAEDLSPEQDEVRSTVHAFHEALSEGDRERVLDLLDPDALIYEAGVPETVEEYRAEHLDIDIEFAEAVSRHIITERVELLRDDAALYMAETHAEGTFRGNDVNSAGVETMVLQEGDDGWRILHVHWSSR